MSGGNWKDMLLASQTGDLELVKYYVKIGVDINYQHPEAMTTPLIESLRFGNLDIARFLLKNNADVHAKEGFSGDTALSVATEKQDQKAINLLQPYLKP
ncbi:ankyrin repeat domain-containing protein [Aquimarina sp. MMG015]|uniref:ankyrin repeat domain-containing protein n=1 Tax=Aquimarina TaxID=290174 RepID=UPI00040555B6|nr:MULTISPECIES: ankyrin repeat domain-containing protein [Aquimarina]AXT54292.1 ankyrin repeat domain-containing protein [Aquimarina sp. AD1]MBQ4804174.1 ankyrin repeat domain-containing protein [Aquimarina sp. MMG015]RKN24611.1 ankyrin repeat domain-containing protein [Aquimarina sp. AD1]